MTTGGELNYLQRKALRRLGRGQSISRTISQDPIISQCFSTGHYPQLSPGMSEVESADWAARMSSGKPRITEYGRTLLKKLDAERLRSCTMETRTHRKGAHHVRHVRV